MKRTGIIAAFAVMALVISSCGTSTKKKMEGKWRWESIRQKSGETLSMMDDELYFVFKKGQYLYHDATAKGPVENWADAVIYTINEETKVMTVISKTGTLEHYRVAFTEDGALNLAIDDAESTLYNDTWILRKTK